ncbi:MAG: hypothetical protein L3K07_00875, partial [Thermoplasmata archaeon]|nr:hypothetical protein [Thermoplasmata archaeon]
EIGSRAIAYGDGMIYGGQQDGSLVAVDAKTGAPAWTVDTEAAGTNAEGNAFGESNPWAVWVATSLSFKGGIAWCTPLCSSSWIHIVGHGGFGFQATSGTSTAFPAQAGDLLLVFASLRGSTPQVHAVTDAAGDTFASVAYSAVSGCCKNGLAIWDAVNVKAATSETLTVTLSTSAPAVVTYLVVAGANRTSPVDARSAFTSANYSSAITNSISAHPGDLVILPVAEWGQFTISSTQAKLMDEKSVLVPWQNETGADFALGLPTNQNNVTVRASLTSATAWVADALALRPSTGVTPPPVEHVVAIVLENHARYEVFQSSPYQRYLAARYAQATSYFALCHPSAPNYLAMTSGATDQCGTDNYNMYNGTNLGDVLETSKKTWASYLESQPASCSTSSQGLFNIHHDPFLYYYDVVTNSTRCSSHLLGSAAFNASVASGTLPSYSLYVPNMIDDCHNSALSTCDTWLKKFLGPILNATGTAEKAMLAHTVFFVTYDESLANDTSGGTGIAGGHVYFVAISPWSLGLSFAATTTPYGFLSTVEWLLGVGSCGNNDGLAANPPMTSLFS